MRSLFLFLIAFALSTSPVLAQGFGQGGTLPNGFPQDTQGQVDGAAQYIILGASATLPNYRTLSPSARFIVTDNGPKGTYQIELATVGLGFGGTGATTQQGAVNAILNFPSKANGDTCYYNGVNWVRLPIGSSTNVLSVSGGIPAWTALGAIPNAGAKFYLGQADGTMTNATVLSNGTGIAAISYNVGGTTTVGVDTTVVATTNNALTMSNKTLTLPTFAWNAGSGVTLAGSVQTELLKWTDPTVGSSGSITLPNPANTALTVITDSLSQTITGVKTFNSATLKLAANNMVTSTGNNATLATGSADTIVEEGATETLTNKTLTMPSFSSSSVTLLQAGGNYTLNWNNPVAGRSIFITDPTVSADFVWLNHSDPYTNGGVFWSNGTTAKISAAGSTGNPLISNGTSAPAYATLGVAGGGTGLTTYGASFPAVLYGSTATTTVALAPGTANQVLAMNGAGTALVWTTGSGGGTVNSGTAGQMAYYASSTNAVSGNANATIATGNLSLGSAGVAGGVTLNGSASGTGVITTQAAAGSAISFVLPSVATVMPTVQATAGQFLQNTGAGVTSWQNAVMFGGNGSDGAVTVATTSISARNYNATTFTITAGNVFTCANCIISTNSTLTIPSTSTLIGEIGSSGQPGNGGDGGYGAAIASTAGLQGLGPAPGQGGAAAALTGAAGGSGAAGNGGNGGGPFSNGSGQSYTLPANGAFGHLDGSGGGGGGSGAGGTGGNAGGGAGHVVIMAIGVAGTGTILNVGHAAAGNGVTVGSGGAGGGGGTVELYNGSGNISAIIVSVAGGSGGTSTTTAGNSGGGGGGYIYVQSAGTTSAATYTVSGGAAGTGAGAVSVAGSAGVANAIQNTLPTLPFIAYNHTNASAAMKCLSFIELTRKTINGDINPSHCLTWDFAKHQTQPHEFISAFYCKPGAYHDLYTCFHQDGGSETSGLCDSGVREQIAQSFAEIKTQKSPYSVNPTATQTAIGDFVSFEGRV